MIERILPAGVSVVDTVEDWHEDVSRFPEEMVALGRAVEKRRSEFVTARVCARRALARIGVPPVAIPSGAHGEPRWPRGVVGSITHCAGYRGCAVAHANEFVAVGIDAEPNLALPDGILEEIAHPRERDRVGALARSESGVRWDRLLFSAKEAVYKAWFPLTRRRLDFGDAAIAFDLERCSFSVRVLPAKGGLGPGEPTSLEGRWWVGEGLVLSALALPVEAGSRLE